MKQFIVEQALHPVANEIYNESSLDIVNIDNPTERNICAPGEFTLGEILSEEDFCYENRVYEDEFGVESFSATFAVKVPKYKYRVVEEDVKEDDLKWYTIPVTWSVSGIVEIEATSIEEAIEKFDDSINDIDLPSIFDYIPDSFARGDYELCVICND